MLWINFLHLYQPANADGHVIKEATDKSYYRIIRALEEHPNIKFTLNITGCLFYRWEQYGNIDLIERIGKLIKKGQIDLVGTAAYHPILPLIDPKEIKVQVAENEEILRKYFGKRFKPRGFFLPEMAYSSAAAKVIKELGYEWIILDEIAYDGKLDHEKCNKIFIDKSSDLKVVLRCRDMSQSFVPDVIKDIVSTSQKIITATDAEIYGLRHIDHTAEFEKLLKNEKLQTQTVSEFIDDQKNIKTISPVACSWESTEKDLLNNQPYALWKAQKNKIHKKLWELANLTYNTIEKYKDDPNYHWARWHMVRGFASCTFWWASAKDFQLFGFISWSPDEIERGINELIRAIRALEDEQTRDVKMKAEKLYIKLKQNIWKKHWKYYWKK